MNNHEFMELVHAKSLELCKLPADLMYVTSTHAHYSIGDWNIAIPLAETKITLYVNQNAHMFAKYVFAAVLKKYKKEIR